MEILSQEFKPIALEINQFQDRLTNNFIEPFCMFILSTFHTNGHSQYLFHLRNIQRDVTVNSHPDGGIQNFCYEEGRFGKPR